MANIDAPRGFRPIAGLSGAPYNGATIKCVLLAAQGTALFRGDPVTLTGTGSSDGYAYPSVGRAAASSTNFHGVVVSFDPDPNDLTLQHRTASTLRVCNVVPALPGQLFVIQADGDFAITDIGETVDVNAGTGDTTTGLSAMELDSSNIGTGLNLLIWGIDPRPDNSLADSGTNADIIVSFNEGFVNASSVASSDIGI